jgi:uncharacterized protein
VCIVEFAVHNGDPDLNDGSAMDSKSVEAPFELDRFEFVLLKRPVNPPTMSEEELDALQELHMAHLLAMTNAGAIRVAGPVEEQSDESLRGMCLYQTGSLERARELAASDPSVLAGRLEVDVMYFYCPKGSL